MNVQLPLLSCVGPPALKNVKISDGGKFSVTRSGLKNTGGYYAPTVWTLKISGTFTAPTKAKGTFSMTELDPGRGGGAVTKSGKQTFRLKFYK
jgi:hypothetical protein